MTDRLRESVSALIDGEADDLEWRRLLAGDDFPQVREIWADFQRARGSLNGCEAALAGLDISGRVQAALLTESVATAPAVAGSDASAWRWWRPAASVAVAASMAAVVVMGMRGLGGDEPGAMAGVAGNGTSAVAGVESAPVSPTAGKVFSAMPSPLRGNGSTTVSASYGGVPGNIVVPVQMYGNQQSRAEAEALLRRRLQTYLLMQVERDHAQQPAQP